MKYPEHQELFEMEYEESNKIMTGHPVVPVIKKFLDVIGYRKIFTEEINTLKRKSKYSSALLSELMILQSTLGYERLEQVKLLANEVLIKKAFNIDECNISIS